MSRNDPIEFSSPPPAAVSRHTPDAYSDSGDELAEAFVTQQTLPWSPSRRANPAAPPMTTQPTQILNSPHRPRNQSHVQVARSSPALERYSSPVMSQSQRPAYNLMAPPGTYALLPQPVARPGVVDLTQIMSDPPVEPDSEEEDTGRSNIPLSEIEMHRTSASRVQETPQKRSFDMSHYAYNPNTNGKRPANDSYTAPQDKKPRLAPRPQNGPSRAMPVQIDLRLEEIPDFEARRLVERLSILYKSKSIQALYDLLVSKRGNYQAAMEALDEEESDDGLLQMPPSFVAKPKEPTFQPKKTAQRGLNAPVKSLQDKYSTIRNTQNTIDISDSPEQPKKRGRLMRGRRNPSPVRKSIPSRSKPITVDSDEDEGIAVIEDDSDDSNPEAEDVPQADHDELLKFFNTCSVEAMLDLANLKEDDTRALLEHRPFASLAEIESIHIDSQATGKKKTRKPKVTFGERLVEAANKMWTGFSAVDKLVQKCKDRGEPIVSTMATWGVDVFGAGRDGELALTSIDDLSDSNSTRDSGIGTPRSGHGSDAEDSLRRGRPITSRTSAKPTLLKKPANMAEDIELKDYQVVGLNWLSLLWEQEVSGILADDMGLGKTCQVIAFLSHLKERNVKGPHLIVVPGSTLENWLREFERFSPELKQHVEPYYGSQTARREQQEIILANLHDIDVIVTTYDLAYKKDDNYFLRKCRPQACIYDEGHVLRNSSSQRYQSLMRIQARCRFLLTGTPLQNSLRELASILAFIMPDIFEDVKDDLEVVFKMKAKVIETSTHGALLSAQRTERARSMLAPFILRRKKDQVLKHLPKKTSRVEYCELTQSQSRIYSAQLERQRQVLLDRAAGIVPKDHANVMMRLRQAAIHPLLFRDRYNDGVIRKMAKACLKVDYFAENNPDGPDRIYEDLEVYQDYQCHQLATKHPRALGKFALKNDEWMDSGKVQKLAELLKKYKANGDRTLIFSQFTSVMDILQWVLDTLDISYSRIDGSTPVPERQGLLDQFYEDESIPVFMLSTKSGGAGINLACANKVIIFDSSFNPQDDQQAENRAHRVGQTREVEVVRLVTKGTVEEQIYALGISKLELDKMVSGEDGTTDTKKTGDKLSAAEEMGIEAVEKMMMEDLKRKEGGGDMKDQFLNGLKAKGLDMSAA